MPLISSMPIGSSVTGMYTYTNLLFHTHFYLVIYAKFLLMVFIRHNCYDCVICSEYNQFKCEVIKLNKKLINQGFQLLSLKHKFELFSKKYIHVWGKYGVDLLCDDILNTLF